MKTNIELAREAGFVSAAYWPEEFKGLAGCVDRLLELHRAQVIEDLAAVEGGPVFWYDEDVGELYSPSDNKPFWSAIPLYTAEQLAANRAKELAEIERLKDHIKHIGNDALRRENAELQARVAELEKPDMFWNADDAEQLHQSIEEFLNDEICNGSFDMEVGAVFTIQQARRLPNVKIKVTAIDDETCEAEYEVIDAARAKEAQ